MRPVDKGDGSSYEANIPKTFDFSGCKKENKALIKKYFMNQLDVPTDECLDFWLQIVKDKIEDKKVKDRTSDDKEKLAVKSMILAKVTDVYKQAGVPMVQTIGGFCCYCDTAIPGLLEVEHRCPKSQYPTFSMDWENFLMSCGPCNNTKRDNPDRDTVSGWMTTVPADEEDYKNEIEHHYLWADIDGNPYKYIIPVLYFNDTGTWKEVPNEYAYNLNNIIVSYDLSTRMVRANLYADKKPDALNVEVSVRLKALSAGTRKDIIDLCGLNNPGNTESTYDRRLVNRTKAWFTALSSIKPLSLLFPAGQKVFDVIWPTVLMTAASTGFFSVWFNMLKKLQDPSGNDLGKRFVMESNKPNLFPGTNTSLVND